MRLQRVAWLLVMAYVVSVSSDTVFIHMEGRKDWSPWACHAEEPERLKDCEEWMRDEAAALNEAHERRTANTFNPNRINCQPPSVDIGIGGCTTPN
jgi:hypothetical protein